MGEFDDGSAAESPRRGDGANDRGMLTVTARRPGWALAALMIILAMLAPALNTAPATAQSSFSEITAAVPGTPQVIGTYTNGCFTGGVALPPDGPGYQVIRLSRNRNWGHPELIDFLQDFGATLAGRGMPPALIADMNQPAGGPISGHASHELGLDADIWLRSDLPRLPGIQREDLSATVMVDSATDDWRVNGAFTPIQAEMIRIAASDPRINRIFVHPAIKLALCEMAWEDRSWLRFVRPWVGHDSHFHVRLNCPADSPYCQPQVPPPPGDGCGAELMSWFPDPNRPDPPPVTNRPPPPPLPAQCQALLQGAG